MAGRIARLFLFAGNGNVYRNIPEYILQFKIKILSLLPVEPAKPLNNAQIGRSFFYIPLMKTSFSKTCYTPQQHITLLKTRGLLIPDEQKAISYLTNIGYFRLSAYFYPLLEFPKEQHRYKSDASFTKVINMYRFDRKLRLLLFNEIEKIEVAIRSCITNYASLDFGNLFWLTLRTPSHEIPLD